MHYIYEKTYIKSVFENLYEKKFIRQDGKLYEFYIENNALLLAVYSDDVSPPLLIENHTLESNVKGEFCICKDEQNIIHIIAANKKYDLVYIQFDGERLKKETIYSFENNMMIPTTPEIQVQNDMVAVVSEFLTVRPRREWSLRVYIRRNGVWDYAVIDKDAGLCYTQPDFKLDGKMQLHVVYREFKEKSSLKYICFDSQKTRHDKPKAIMGTETDKYEPSVFINRFDEIYITWVEFDESDVHLCCANINEKNNQEACKIKVSQNLAQVRIYFSGWHIYCLFQNEPEFYYDLCCGKKVTKHWNPKIIPEKGGGAMGSDFRQFLDIKRELEYRISELENQTKDEEFKQKIEELKQRNEELLSQVDKNASKLEEIQNEMNLLKLENNELKGQLEDIELKGRWEAPNGEENTEAEHQKPLPEKIQEEPPAEIMQEMPAPVHQPEEPLPVKQPEEPQKKSMLNSIKEFFVN